MLVVALFILLSSCCCPDKIWGSPSENEVKAAFVFNFIKFVEWPETPGNDTFTIRYIGIDPLSGNLRLLEKREANDRKILVENLVDSTGEFELLFISASEINALPEILTSIADKPILTVSDAPKFVRSGGMIELLVIDNKIRFAINLAAAEKVGLKISSQLLRLATEVIK